VVGAGEDPVLLRLRDLCQRRFERGDAAIASFAA
jgi:hypothetical protein